MPSTLRILPLGGLGEIGMNCMAIETPEGILVVDCGVMFPDSDMPGVGRLYTPESGEGARCGARTGRRGPARRRTPSSP